MSAPTPLTEKFSAAGVFASLDHGRVGRSRGTIERKCGLPPPRPSGRDFSRFAGRGGRASLARLRLENSRALLSPSLARLPSCSLRACGIWSHVSLPLRECVMRAFHANSQNGSAGLGRGEGAGDAYECDSATPMRGEPGPAASSAERDVASPLCARD